MPVAFNVPASSRLGPRAISVGIDDSDTAITAECSIQVQAKVPAISDLGMVLMVGLILAALLIFVRRGASV